MVRPVLHLDPILRPAASVRSVTSLRDQALESHTTYGPEQVRPDCAALELADKDTVGAATPQPVELGLAR
jgi:hypothetical protein